MAATTAVVGIPKHGRCAHPENLSLALDGRGKICIAQRGASDSQEHLGSLFWLASRTPTTSQANLVPENVVLEQLIKVSLPGPDWRKVVSVHWEYSEMPSIPILVNKKTLKQRTKLFVFQMDKQIYEKNKETEQ